MGKPLTMAVCPRKGPEFFLPYKSENCIENICQICYADYN